LSFSEITIFSNGSHLEWKVRLPYSILKGDNTRTILAKFGLVESNSFKEEIVNAF
jgi:hypothetical protein